MAGFFLVFFLMQFQVNTQSYNEYKAFWSFIPKLYWSLLFFSDCLRITDRNRLSSGWYPVLLCFGQDSFNFVSVPRWVRAKYCVTCWMDCGWDRDATDGVWEVSGQRSLTELPANEIYPEQRDKLSALVPSPGISKDSFGFDIC